MNVVALIDLSIRLFFACFVINSFPSSSLGEYLIMMILRRNVAEFILIDYFCIPKEYYQ